MPEPSREHISSRAARTSLLRQRWPVLLWIAVAIFALWLFQQHDRQQGLSGLIESRLALLGPVETGAIRAVHVLPGQRVRSGTLLFEMDTRLVDESIKVTAALLEEARANSARQFQTAMQRMEEEIRGYELSLASSRAEWEVYKAEADRLDRLFAQKLITAESLASVKAREAGLAQVVALYPDLIARTRLELDQMRDLRDAVAQSGTDPSEVSRRSELDLLRQQRELHFVHAPADGVVVDVLLPAGSSVVRGTPVLQFLPDGPPRILAFCPEDVIDPPAIGQNLHLSRRSQPHFTVLATVVDLHPVSITIPDTVSPLPNRFIRGRTVLLEPSQPLPADWIPGSSVDVTYLQARRINRFKAWFKSLWQSS